MKKIVLLLSIVLIFISCHNSLPPDSWEYAENDFYGTWSNDITTCIITEDSFEASSDTVRQNNFSHKMKNLIWTKLENNNDDSKFDYPAGYTISLKNNPNEILLGDSLYLSEDKKAFSVGNRSSEAALFIYSKEK